MRCLFLLAFLFSISASAKTVRTNAVEMPNAPDWVTVNRVDKVVEHIQMILEWDIRRIKALWYMDQAAFEKVHGMGRTVVAVSMRSQNTVHLGPRVNSSNFDQVFTHELVHVISYQKYKDAIPKWLEEGLANYLGKVGKVDYDKLAAHPFPKDVRELTHPFAGSEEGIHYTYMASQALAEMIAKKCDLQNLLRLSVGAKMESYLDTYCEIHDLNAEFKKWVLAHVSRK